MITVLHVLELYGANPWFNGFGDHHDSTRFRHLVASLGSRNGLHDSLAQHRVGAFALDAPSRRQFPLAVARLRRLIRREHVDIVQTHLFDPTSVGLAAAKLARVPLTIVTRHHAHLTTVFRKPVHRQIDRLHAFAADRIWTPSSFAKECMVRYEGVSPSHITVLPHGFDFERMRPRLTPERRRALRDELGGDDKILIGMVARLSVEKCHEDLLCAAKEVIAARPRARFVLAGDGPRRGELERMTAELGLSAHVRFTGWRDDSWDVMEAMDLMAQPTRYESFGNVYVEAMALERPLVGVRAAAAPEVIDDGETGVLVPPEAPAALANALIALIDDPERARRLGLAARQRVIERYNFPQIMRRYERAYDEWLAARRR